MDRWKGAINFYIVVISEQENTSSCAQKIFWRDGASLSLFFDFDFLDKSSFIRVYRYILGAFCLPFVWDQSMVR